MLRTIIHTTQISCRRAVHIILHQFEPFQSTEQRSLPAEWINICARAVAVCDRDLSLAIIMIPLSLLLQTYCKQHELDPYAVLQPGGMRQLAVFYDKWCRGAWVSLTEG